jgi:WD40 repeat protein
MPQSVRTFRIFVSSTFSDLVAERSALQERVFPRLRDLASAHGYRFQAIDLRWGVSDEAALDQQTMRICLGEIARCQKVTPRPNFVILLGDRYGWRPQPFDVPADEFEQFIPLLEGEERHLLEQWYRRDDNAEPAVYVLQPRAGEFVDSQNWERVEAGLRSVFSSALGRLSLSPDALLKYSASATEQEIVAGALRVEDSPEHVFCFLRNIEGLPAQGSASCFWEADAEAARRQAELKERLRKRLPGNVHEYPARWLGEAPSLDHLDRLCEDVFAELSRVILAEVGRQGSIDPGEREKLAHAVFGEERASVFIGRADLLGAVEAYVTGSDPHPLVIWGASGSGKSALMAKAVEQAGKHGQEVVCRFIGTTPESSGGRALLESLCKEIRLRHRKDGSPLPSDYRNLVFVFQSTLALATPDKPLFLFLDALDQLSDVDDARSLAWLPAELPSNVRLVVSTLPGECLQALESTVPAENRLEMQRMSLREGEALLDTWLANSHRRIQDGQRKHVLDRFGRCGLPLYLKLAVEEARLWRSYDPVPDLSEDIPGILRDLFKRLSEESSHGSMLVSRSLGYLAAARNGLSEDELLDILSLDSDLLADFRRRSPRSPEVEHLPVVVWSRLYFDLEPYLAERSADGASLLAFYHRQMAEACRAAYCERDRNAALAAYFGAQPLHLERNEQAPNLRKLSEMVYQQAWAGLAAGVERTLLDFSYLRAKLAGQGLQELIADYALASEAGMRAEKQSVLGLVQNALRASSHVLERDPLQLPGQLTGQLLGFGRPEFDGLVEQARAQVKDPWLRPLHGCLDASGGALLRTLVGHTDEVLCVAITPNGRWVVSGSADKTLKVWDLGTGRCLGTMDAYQGLYYGQVPAGWDRSAEESQEFKKTRGHKDRVLAVAVTPNGQWALSGSQDSTIKRWGLPGGLCWDTLYGHGDRVTAVAVTPDGRRAVSGSGDETLRAWDLQTGECLHRMEGRKDYVNSVAFTPDGRQIVIGSGGWTRTYRSYTVQVWDLETGTFVRWMEGHKGQVLSAAVTPDGRRIVSGSVDTTLKLWDLETGECLRTMEGHTDYVTSAVVTADGKRAISGSQDTTLKVWDLETGTCLRTLEGHARGVSSVVLAPDARRVISASKDNTLKIWDLESSEGEALPRKLDRHTKQVNAVVLSPDGRQAVTGSDDTTLRVWNLDSGECLGTLKGHSKSVQTVAITPDGQQVVSGSEDNSLRVWDLGTGACAHVLKGHGDRVTAVAITTDAQTAVSASYDSRLRLWSLESGACLRTLEGHKTWVWAIALVPSRQWVVSASGIAWNPVGGGSNVVKVWSLRSYKCLRTLEGHTNPIEAVGVAPARQWAVSCSADRTARVWDLRSGRCIHTLDHAAPVRCAALTPDEMRVVTGSDDGALRVWNLKTGECLRKLEGHTQGIGSVAVTPGGQWVVSGAGSVIGSGDHAIKVWDLESGRCLATFEGNGAMNCLALAPDGRTILAGDQGGRVYFLRMENVGVGAPLLTAWRWRFSSRWLPWKRASFAMDCPNCGTWSDIPSSALGSEIPCPSCGSHVRLSPFTIRGDWRRIVRAWKGT